MHGHAPGGAAGPRSGDGTLRAEVDESADRSFALLSFEHRNGDGRHAFVTDGSHSEIISHLGRINGLRFISRLVCGLNDDVLPAAGFGEH